MAQAYAELSREGSQKVAIYTKLESFETAGDRVRDLLRTVLENSDVEVVPYTNLEKGSENLPVTVMVVIDARQTRTLITPERGDRNVDHVAELGKLERETSPKGSILIVIYGDEHSKALSVEEHIAKYWLVSWKFNDTKAYDLALKGRLFSINTDFNKKQEEMLHQYFQWLPGFLISMVQWFPDVRVSASTIVIGEKCKEQVSCLFTNNPFYKKLPSDGSDDGTQYGYPFAPSGKELTIRIDFNTSLYEVKVCESTDFRIALESQLKSLNTTRYGTTPSKINRSTYNNALLSCHCSKCYKILMLHRDEVKAVIYSETFDVMNDVISVVSEDQADDVSGVALNYINEVRRKTKQRSIQEGEMDAKSLLQATILMACHDNTSHRKGMCRYRKYVTVECLCAVLVMIVIIVATVIAILLYFKRLSGNPC